MSHSSSNAGYAPALYFLAGVSFLNGSKPYLLNHAEAGQLAGLERTKAEGKHLGRSKSIDDAAVTAWHAENSASIKTTAEHFGISQASVKRACAKR